jgi:hypothetical protein
MTHFIGATALVLTAGCAQSPGTRLEPQNQAGPS